MKSIVKWQKVNLRAKEKNLPKLYEDIVYLSDSGGIVSTQMVSDTTKKGKIEYYTSGYYKKITSGFTWCYVKDIITIDEED